MTDNVIGLNGVNLSTPVEKQTPNYTKYLDGSIRLTSRGMALYAEASHRLGIDIRRIRTLNAMQDLQNRAWKLMLSDLCNDSRVPESNRAAISRLWNLGIA